MNNFINVFRNARNIIWPMITISIVVIISIRIAYIIKNHEKIYLFKDIITLLFIIYVLSLFQIVTFQDYVSWSGNNFTPFKEMFRYAFGSRLFIKNVIGNVCMFLPFGFFISYYTKSNNLNVPLIITIVTSFTIEVVQLSIGRVFDVDDIILNIIGGVLGYIIYIIVKKIYNIIPIKYREIICNIFVLLFLVLFIYVVVVI